MKTSCLLSLLVPFLIGLGLGDSLLVTLFFFSLALFFFVINAFFVFSFLFLFVYVLLFCWCYFASSSFLNIIFLTYQKIKSHSCVLLPQNLKICIQCFKFAVYPNNIQEYAIPLNTRPPLNTMIWLENLSFHIDSIMILQNHSHWFNYSLEKSLKYITNSLLSVKKWTQIEWLWSFYKCNSLPTDKQWNHSTKKRYDKRGEKGNLEMKHKHQMHTYEKSL